MKDKPFKLAIVRDLEDKVTRGEISYSKFVELLNEKAIEWSKEREKEAYNEALCSVANVSKSVSSDNGSYIVVDWEYFKRLKKD